jgi:molybdopterin molybdotransferase
MEFLKVDSIETAREKLLSGVKDWIVLSETVPAGGGLGRILAEDIFSPCDIPSFRRSTVDGYAVLSGDTAAAGDSSPVRLKLKGQVEIGEPALFSITHGECAEIPTGGALPDGADAAVMVEYTDDSDFPDIAVYNAVSHGDNIVNAGEDAGVGEPLIRSGKRLLPQDIGTLAAAGVTAVTVFTSPRVFIISTGDELVPPEQTPAPGQVRDINTSALKALAEKSGFIVTGAAVLPDCGGVLSQTLRRAMETSDIVIISGGSSKGKRDITGKVISRVSSPGIFTHGLAVKPGKPTILGTDGASRTLLVGLPGHPVSAMIVFELLLNWMLRELTGNAGLHAIPARLTANAPSSPGRLTCWPVKLERTDGAYSAEPVFGKSGLITTLAKADGYFTADRDTEGLTEGQTVWVHLF